MNFLLQLSDEDPDFFWTLIGFVILFGYILAILTLVQMCQEFCKRRQEEPDDRDEIVTYDWIYAHQHPV